MTDNSVMNSVIDAPAQQDYFTDETFPEDLSVFMTYPAVFTAEQVATILPQAYPFIFVDRVLYREPNRRVVGIKNLTLNEGFFQGHFPNRPTMPGVLILEAMAQLCMFSLDQTIRPGEILGLFAGVDRIRFRRPVIPGDQLIMASTVLKVRSNRYIKFHCRSQVQSDLVAEGDLIFHLADWSD